MDLALHNIGVLRLRTMLRFRPTGSGAVVKAAVEERYRSLDTDQNRTKIAETIESFIFGLEPDIYTRYRGSVRSAGRLDVIIADLILESELLGAADRFTIRLQFDSVGERFEILEAEKQPQGFGSDGCVPLKMRAQFSAMVVRDDAVFRVGERFGRVIDEREIRWDWQPRWNFGRARLSGGLAEETLVSLFGKTAEEQRPAIVLLATWSFSTLRRDWGENGQFVRLVIDPEGEQLIHRIGDDWFLLY